MEKIIGERIAQFKLDSFYEKNFPHTFLHIFGNNYDYTVGYYGYFFSEAIAVYLFEFVQKNDALPDFIRKILAPGNEKSGLELVKDFCGRWDSVPFLRARGCSQ